jgi:hypothetical protein
LIDNPEETLEYFDKNHDELKSHRSVNFDLSSVEEMTPDAIAVLLSKIKDPNYTNRTPLAGKSPEERDLKRMFINSGFFKYVFSASRLNSHYVENILTKIGIDVDTQIFKDITKAAAQHVFQEDIYQNLYTALIEITKNTKHHASKNKGKSEDWWIFLYKHAGKKKVSVTIHDNGIGVIHGEKLNGIKHF